MCLLLVYILQKISQKQNKEQKTKKNPKGTQTNKPAEIV